MSIWFFLREWFGVVPTVATFLRRSMINAAVAIGLIFVCMLARAPADYTVFIVVGIFIANGAMGFFYLQQRNRSGF
ncbi:hypothetical protein J2X36_005449 [Methylobacterium sp. BE186]|uniref:hypothetical protein n=1 Tax=Methylobacterium sp. BE186 TaxID=2817715 RepID=UPI002860C0B2|nr:hypothetical protein [Methylobacterium sp. BE186]MDR7040662.1 hypothetical protein [Methylobacterium sp. BE186]